MGDLVSPTPKASWLRSHPLCSFAFEFLIRIESEQHKILQFPLRAADDPGFSRGIPTANTLCYAGLRNEFCVAALDHASSLFRDLDCSRYGCTRDVSMESKAAVAMDNPYEHQVSPTPSMNPGLPPFCWMLYFSVGNARRIIKGFRGNGALVRPLVHKRSQ